MKLSGWGRYNAVETELIRPSTQTALAATFADGPVIARGNGRAYGDSAVSSGRTVDMRSFNHMLAFDDQTGVLEAEAGVLLSEIIATFLPRGWYPMVTPGTKFVTLGGMIAADVHGKNHHKDGSMAATVQWVDVMDADGQVRRCSPTENAALFAWIPGAMGLTGIILRAAIKLKKVETGWISQTTIPAPNLKSAMIIFEGAQDFTYSVAWIDCLQTGRGLGRSLIMLGEHAPAEQLSFRERHDPFALKPKRQKRLPFDAPDFALSGPVVKAFNSLYYWKGSRGAGTRLVDWDTYFYPLDAILEWNRAYGRRGFVQFQCALPLETSQAGLEALLKAIGKAGSGSFLAVLKRFGAQGGMFSFPMPGYTLALDFPANAANLALLKELDAITIDHGGRFYLAKDARITPKVLRESDTRVPDFIDKRAALNTDRAFRSAQSERLSL